MIITRKDKRGVKIMSNIIYTIPDSIGWIIVGAIGVLCFIMFVLLALTAIEEIKSGKDNK